MALVERCDLVIHGAAVRHLDDLGLHLGASFSTACSRHSAFRPLRAKALHGRAHTSAKATPMLLLPLLIRILSGTCTLVDPHRLLLRES